MEPHVKEGRGGLRDLQTLYWLARYAFGVQRMPELVGPDSPGGGLLTPQEARAIRRAWDFLWTVRFHLHYVTGRAEERLTFDLQPVVGARMGYTRHGLQDGVERFMKHFFLTVRDVVRLTRILEPAIERAALGPPAVVPAARRGADAKPGFALADGKMHRAHRAATSRIDPVLMLRIFRMARDRGLEIHPLAFRAHRCATRATRSRLRGDAEASALFLDLLSGPRRRRTWLRMLNEAGLALPLHAGLGAHRRADAVRHLPRLHRGRAHDRGDRRAATRWSAASWPRSRRSRRELIGQLQSRRALYVAMLLHDIAKGRGGDHSASSARSWRRTSARMLGLTPEETETVSWLVLHHLLISQTAFKRDIEDPKTILDIAEAGAVARTAAPAAGADGGRHARASGPRCGTAGRRRCCASCTGAWPRCWPAGCRCPERDVRVARAQAKPPPLLLADLAEGGGRCTSSTSAIPATGCPSTPRRMRATPRMIQRGGGEQGAADRAHPRARSPRGDRGDGLLPPTIRACSAASPARWRWRARRIVDARIHTMTNGMALDTFWVQDAPGGAFDAPHRLARLSVLIEQSLSGRLRLARRDPQAAARAGAAARRARSRRAW